MMIVWMLVVVNILGTFEMEWVNALIANSEKWVLVKVRKRWIGFAVFFAFPLWIRMSQSKSKRGRSHVHKRCSCCGQGACLVRIQLITGPFNCVGSNNDDRFTGFPLFTNEWMNGVRVERSSEMWLIYIRDWIRLTKGENKGILRKARKGEEWKMELIVLIKRPFNTEIEASIVFFSVIQSFITYQARNENLHSVRTD